MHNNGSASYGMVPSRTWIDNKPLYDSYSMDFQKTPPTGTYPCYQKQNIDKKIIFCFQLSFKQPLDTSKSVSSKARLCT